MLTSGILLFLSEAMKCYGSVSAWPAAPSVSWLEPEASVYFPEQSITRPDFVFLGSTSAGRPFTSKCDNF